MSAIRKLAAEATDNGLLAPELAAGISRVKSAKTQGTGACRSEVSWGAAEGQYEKDERNEERRQVMAIYRPKYRDPNTGGLVRSSILWYEFNFAGRRVRESSKSTRKTLATLAEQNRRKEL
jgi:hypothetical protein